MKTSCSINFWYNTFCAKLKSVEKKSGYESLNSSFFNKLFVLYN